MANVAAVITSIRNIMRQDRGISGDAQRLEQLGWMLFLKIMDDKDQELEITKDDYLSVIPERFQWRNWAADAEGITGDELLEFIDSNAENNKGLFATLRDITSPKNPNRAAIVKEVFEGSNNYMKSGYEMRKVINKLNEINFNNSEDKHIFGDIYESILIELRDAGNKGEYYTPRAITQLMTKMTDPKLGEKVLDPAAGTGGFLTAAIDHVREHYVKTVDDEHVLQKSITGWELKPVSYVLGLTNLILHEMDVPDYDYRDSLKTEYAEIGLKDYVDVILANPPFGATIADGVESNFPATYRTKESADLFVVLMMKLLKANGRSAIVLPDGSITGDGIKARIREKLLTEFNLHTIIRLPQTTFFPATVSTNLLFFEKGSPTKEIWYYEHKLPEGQKSYSKTKPIQFSEFEPLIEWWYNRKESDVSWKVKVEDLKNWNLDIKNPVEIKKILGTPKEYFASFKTSENSFKNTLQDIVDDLNLNKNSFIFTLLDKHSYLLKDLGVIKQLKQSILQEAIQGKLTNEWRKQNPNVEPASILLERIKTEKKRLIKEKKLKKEKPLSPIESDKIPFELPEGWVWCRFKDIVNFQLGKTPASKQHSYWSHGQYHWLNIRDMEHMGYVTTTAKKITQQAVDEVFKKQKIVPVDTLLMSFKLTVGKMAINKIPLYHNEAIISIFPYEGISKNFLFHVLPEVTELSASKKVLMGQTFNSSSLSSMIFPLPPEEEQNAIIAKIDSLMKKISIIENEIINSEKHAEMLMQSVLKEAFERKKDTEPLPSFKHLLDPEYIEKRNEKQKARQRIGQEDYTEFLVMEKGCLDYGSIEKKLTIIKPRNIIKNGKILFAATPLTPFIDFKHFVDSFVSDIGSGGTFTAIAVLASMYELGKRLASCEINDTLTIAVVLVLNRYSCKKQLFLSNEQMKSHLENLSFIQEDDIKINMKKVDKILHYLKKEYACVDDINGEWCLKDEIKIVN